MPKQHVTTYDELVDIVKAMIATHGEECPQPYLCSRYQEAQNAVDHAKPRKAGKK